MSTAGFGLSPALYLALACLVASLVNVRFSLVSGGLICVGAVVAVCALLPGFVRYRTEPGSAKPVPEDS